MLSAAASLQAQATRTWVSGVGDDVNPCSRTAPCKTFAGAISKTAAGGEISALDPGGFSAVTITKAITINGGGMLASILGTSVISKWNHSQCRRERYGDHPWCLSERRRLGPKWDPLPGWESVGD
jgi:hypothetical protein